MKNAEKRQILVDRYIDFFHLAYIMLGNKEDAMDAVQEAVVSTLTCRGVREVEAYCFQAVRFAAINILRRRSRLKSLEGLDVADDNRQEQLLTRLGELRDELPEAIRSLVVLHDEQDFSYQQLASLSGLSVSSVRRKIAEAHQQMKDQLEKDI